jgi:hypothetical protein
VSVYVCFEYIYLTVLMSMRVWVRVSVFACIYTFVLYRHDQCVCDGLNASVNGVCKCVSVFLLYFAWRCERKGVGEVEERRGSKEFVLYTAWL